MTTLNTLIVDDEDLARRGLEIRLANYPDIRITGQCRNGREALQAVAASRPDVIFLDVQMPGMDGFDVLRRLAGADMPAVIFVTAYDKFAIKAFEANAIDYLLKPINDERLDAAVGRARAGDRQAAEHRKRLLHFICDLTGRELTLHDALAEAADSVARFPRRLAIRDGKHSCCIDIHDIDWVDAAGDYMCLHVQGDTHILRGTMKELEDMLDPATFVRVHRSAIVNRQRVRALRAHRNGEYFLTLDGDHELKLSRTYKSNLSKLADNL